MYSLSQRRRPVGWHLLKSPSIQSWLCRCNMAHLIMWPRASRARAGATYDLGNDVSLYVFATENSSDEIDDESEVGVGISYVF